MAPAEVLAATPGAHVPRGLKCGHPGCRKPLGHTMAKRYQCLRERIGRGSVRILLERRGDEHETRSAYITCFRGTSVRTTSTTGTERSDRLPLGRRFCSLDLVGAGTSGTTATDLERDFLFTPLRKTGDNPTDPGGGPAGPHHGSSSSLDPSRFLSLPLLWRGRLPACFPLSPRRDVGSI